MDPRQEFLFARLYRGNGGDQTNFAKLLFLSANVDQVNGHKAIGRKNLMKIVCICVRHHVTLYRLGLRSIH